MISSIVVVDNKKRADVKTSLLSKSVNLVETKGLNLTNKSKHTYSLMK